MIRIAVDAMGGDHAPAAIVQGALNALTNNPDLEIVLVGREQAVTPLVPPGAPRVSIVNADEVIETGEDPLVAIRRKRGASMLIALNLLKEKKVDACVSAGSTGAFMSGALFNVGRIKGIQRPALAPLLPTRTGHALLIDCGANADCKPEFLLQFAQMGSVYMKRVMEVPNPKVGLLNIGAEEEKGSALYKETYQLLKSAPVNFHGNVEGRDAFDGTVDVIVADGFAGNILLKTAEGAAMFLFDLLKEQLTASLPRKLAAAVLRPGFRAVKRKMDYAEIGGSLLLGIEGIVVKAHGSCKERAFESAIRQAYTAARRDVVGNIRTALEAVLTQENG